LALCLARLGLLPCLLPKEKQKKGLPFFYFGAPWLASLTRTTTKLAESFVLPLAKRKTKKKALPSSVTSVLLAHCPLALSPLVLLAPLCPLALALCLVCPVRLLTSPDLPGPLPCALDLPPCLGLPPLLAPLAPPRLAGRGKQKKKKNFTKVGGKKKQVFNKVK
jgi:hypothetical protein